MFDERDNLLIPSPRKDVSYPKCNECTQNLCPDAYIRDIQNPFIFFFHPVISGMSDITANDYNQQPICIVSILDREGNNLLLVRSNRVLFSLFIPK